MKPVPLEVTMMKIIGELKAENARLKAEVERLTKLLGMCESIDKSIDVWIESKIQAASGDTSK